jgi:hypothetical protein
LVRLLAVVPVRVAALREDLSQRLRHGSHPLWRSDL